MFDWYIIWFIFVSCDYALSIGASKSDLSRISVSYLVHQANPYRIVRIKRVNSF
jgi:hypothetical protein